MKNWTIGKRIICGFATLLVLVGILAITSFVLLRQVRAEAEFVDTDVMPCQILMAKIKNTVGDIQIKVLQNILTKNPEERKKIEAEVAAMRADILKAMDAYKKMIDEPEDRDLFAKLERTRDNYVAIRSQLFELSRADKMDEAAAFNASTLKPAYDAYQTAVDNLVTFNLKDADNSTERSKRAAQRASLITSGLSLAVILLGIVFAFITVTSLNRSLRHLADSLGEGAEQVVSAAGQVSSSSQTLAEGASEQAASLEETSSSLEEMASMTKRNAENSQKANDLAKQARSAADKGAADMQTMSAAMEATKVSSDDIAKIIKTIDEIAFQTNILALNAAVEAARAGEAGMGFAVVADEVRNLAQRSAQAAKETAAKIEGAIAKTAQGVEINGKVAATLNEIVIKARQVDELAAEVAGASREQTQGIIQINTAVGQMDKVTQSNAASAEESAAAAEELNAQAEAMKQSVMELLHLVGGNGQATVTRTGATPLRTWEAHIAAPMAKRPAPIHGNGNGHSRAEPATAGATNGRSLIPLEDDFKNF